MDTPGGDHIAAIAADIDSLAKATDGVPNTSAIATKIAVASFARLDRDRLFKAAVFRLQLLQARLADVAIHIEYEDTRTAAPWRCRCWRPAIFSTRL